MKIVKLVCCCAMFMASVGAMAAPFTYTWSTTDDGTSSGDLAGTPGRPVVISITLDNGGSTNVNQTWGPNQLTSVSFSISGSVVSTIDVTHPDHTLIAAGVFQSNAAGDLTVMLSSFRGTMVSQAPVTPGTDTDPVGNWYVTTSGNTIYISGGGSNSLKVNNHLQMNTASNWQRAGIATPPASNNATAVPSMPMVAFGILGLMLSFFGGRFKAKGGV